MSCEVADEQLVGAVDESTTEEHPWYSDTKYDRYWSHYKQMKAWMQGQQSPQGSLMNAWTLSYQQYLQHYQWWMYQNSLTWLSSPHHHQMHHPYHSHPQSWHSHHSSRTHHHHHHPYPPSHHHHPYPPSHHHHQDSFHHPYKPHPGTTSYRCNKQYVTDQSDVDYLDNGFSETAQEDEDEGGGGGGEEEEEFEVELSEEMRQFFLQSQKHREELKELKLALNQKKHPEKTSDGDVLKDTKQDETYADEFEISFTSSKKSRKKHIIGAPVEQPGRRRAEEMKILYGKDSPAIHGMETAIQMQFDRNCDKKQPTFWPTVPLKM